MDVYQDFCAYEAALGRASEEVFCEELTEERFRSPRY
jgi:hypothetical protein